MQRILNPKKIVFDVETTNYNFGSAFDARNFLVCIVVYVSWNSHYFKYHSLDSSVSNCTLSDIRTIFRENKEATIIGHNLKFDIHWLDKEGIEHGEIYFDTMFPAYIWSEGQYKKGDFTLDRLSGSSKENLGNLLVHKHEINPADMPPKWAIRYCVQDVRATKDLAKRQFRRIQCDIRKIKQGNGTINPNLYNAPIRLMNNVLPVVIEMEQNGLLVDRDKLEEIYTEQKAKYRKLEQELLDYLIVEHNLEGFNLNSSEQISHFIYSKALTKETKPDWNYFFSNYQEYKDRGGVKLQKAIKKYFVQLEYGLHFEPVPGALGKASLSVGRDVLKEMLRRYKEHPQIEVLRTFYELSRLQTLISTFIEGTIKQLYQHSNGEWYLHTSYNQIIAVTGRWTSSGPNIQNWPRSGTFPVKECVVPRFKNGKLCKADASQIELRYGGWYYRDNTLKADYLRGVDIHGTIAAKAFGKEYTDEQRTITKSTVFRVWYRGSANSIIKDEKIPLWDINKAKEIVDTIYDRYKAVKEGQEIDYQKVLADGGRLETPTGRVYRIKTHFPSGKVHWGAKFKIANYPIQGGGTADLMQCAMIAAYKMMKQCRMESKLISYTHDDIVVDMVESELERVPKLLYWALTDGAKQEWLNHFGFEFDFPLDCDPEIKEHW